MGTEIERKFLVVGEAWRGLAPGVRYRQGYLSTVKQRTVRVRTVGERAYLTVKGVSRGLSRAEFEYEIPLQDANSMLDELCERPLIAKKRYKIPLGAFIWEVDEFEAENAGLIIAEVELEDADQTIPIPDWVGAEVSEDPRYFNANLISHPYQDWA
jgi:adenylate cyclase